jgi:hypothetical protein
MDSSTGRPRTPAEIEAYAEAVADVLCAYLSAIGAAQRGPSIP